MQQQNNFRPSDSSTSSHLGPSALALPSHSMQNQIHELAKTLPPPRKQNTACDACRSRKVKCNRLDGQEKCQHCLSKNYPCTHFVQQATSEKKRSNVSRRPRNVSSAGPPSPVPQKITSPTTENGSLPPTPSAPKPPSPLPLLVQYGFYPAINRRTPSREVLDYIFAPPVHHNPQAPYALWGELAHKLENDAFKVEFALDLVEVFFQIVHTRIPLLNPQQFRDNLRLVGEPVCAEDVLHPALVATVIAWGTKFSEHPLLVADRRRPGNQSLLAKALVDRARDLAEALKVHRLPTSDHVVIGLLLEPLQSQNPEDPNRFHCFWVSASTRHLLDLQVNHKSVLTTISDPDARGTMIFAFWMACIADAYGSVFYRHKPVLDDDDYDIDFYTVDPINAEGGDSRTDPREQLEFLGYYRAAHSLARTARQISRNLWRPSTESDGVPFEVLYMLTSALSTWRDDFLAIVGVPSNFEGEWDFVSAVSSCASDATYHVMWVILFMALDDFGIKEINEVTRMNQPVTMVPNHAQIDMVKRKVAEEALHGALRIAGLAAVLTSNGYLRLDPAVMLASCIQSGNLLARLGRPEVSNIIEGLRQYSSSYEEAGEQATEMRRVYTQVRAGEAELQHMANSLVAPDAQMEESTGNGIQDAEMYESADYSVYSR